METNSKSLFVDANIFLGFYHFSNDDLEELDKLATLIDKGELKLFATRQVIDEINRNRDVKIQDAYKRFRGIDLKISLPKMCQGYPEYESIRKALSQAEHERIELDKKLSGDIEARSLKADEVIAKLLSVATVLDSAPVMERAHMRFLSGNPPGKNNSYGDAITWETLLESTPDGEDLFFISDDKDYKSPLDDEQFDSFLKAEWVSKKSSNIYYYPRLSSFFSEHHKEIALKQEARRRLIIEALARSRSFARTHRVIRALNSLGSFTTAEAIELVEAAFSNAQVYSIMTDPDVKKFFSELLIAHSDAFEGELRSKLIATLNDSEEETSVAVDDNLWNW